jgi:hypothetical protein
VSEVLSEEPVRLPREPSPAPDRPRAVSRRPRRWGVLLALVLVAGGVAAYADARDRSHEAAGVAACERQVRVATGLTERRLGLMNNYLQPAATAGGHVQQLHLADLMAARAGKALPRVQRAVSRCATVHVRPWHFSLVERQAASDAYAAALVTLVQTVAAQGHTPFHDDATLQRLREAAGVSGG